MSVSNLLEPNNIDLFCNDITLSGTQSSLNGFIKTYSGAVTTTTTTPVNILSIPVTNNNGGYGIEITCCCYVTVSSLGHLGYQVLQTVPYTVSFLGGTGTAYTADSNANTLIYGFPQPPTAAVGAIVTVSGTNINIAVENGYGDSTDWFYQIKVFGEIL